MSDSYLSAVKGSVRYVIACDAYRDDAIVPGGKNLELLSGSVTDDSTPGVRRQLDLELVPRPGLFDVLAPVGTLLKVRSVLYYPSDTTESVPMGVFDVDSTRLGYGPGGTLTVQASDKWVRIQRARFLAPFATNPALTVKEQIAVLIRRALGSDEPVNITATSNALVGKLVFERDADEAIIEMQKSIGAWTFFDRNGVATIADLPTAQLPVWTVGAGSRGVLLDADRGSDRSKTYNVVVVNSEVVDDVPLFPPQYVWDNDPSSPTFAASGSGSGATPPDPNTAGAFGLVPYFYSSPLLRSASQGLAAGATILNRVKGLNAQMSLSALRNHALDSIDAITVLLPGTPEVQEVHAIDKIVHPLAPATQSISTRATNTAEAQ